MLATGCVKGVLEWRDSRAFFYHRVRSRLLAEAVARAKVTKCKG